ncbi:hypothetical protein KDL45_08720 [bacterium]|nr:hypothetical protein [bacterium]MCB9475595.1 hypothetical protein [Deltaproteobacteria bacterium]
MHLFARIFARFLTYALVAIGIFLLVSVAAAYAYADDDFDPDLQSKADEYQVYLEEWHAAPAGALTGGVQYTDGTRQEISCLHHQGDSTIWTGMYLGSQAIRYEITGDPDALAEMRRVTDYLLFAMDVTQTPGYVARFADVDEMPWNCGYTGDHGWKNAGTGDYEGYYWIDHTSRDQYSGWWMGLSLAHDALPLVDFARKRRIEQAFTDVIEMLRANNWNITDQNGEYTGNGAAWIGFVKRISWLLMAAHATDNPDYWALLDEQYEANKNFFFIDTWSFLNKYSEFYGNNLRHLDWYSIFRLWPEDDARLDELWDVWQRANRPSVTAIYNPWFDAVHVAGCRKLDACDDKEMAQIVKDTKLTLDQYWDAPSYRRAVTCSEAKPDLFSVWADNWLSSIPWLEGIFNIDPIARKPRQLADRSWTDMYWQSGEVWALSCSSGEDQAYTGPGFDYILAYWINVYYGVLPGYSQ